MKRIAVGAGLLLVLGMLAVLFVKWGGAKTGPSAPQVATLLHLGSTNLNSLNFAVFCLTNGTSAHFACIPEAFEELNEGIWIRTPLTGRARRVVGNWIGVGEELQPGQAFTFFVPPPTTGAVWRLVFMCQEQAPIIDPVTDTVRHITDTNAVRTNLRQFSGRRYYVVSPQVRQ